MRAGDGVGCKGRSHDLLAEGAFGVQGVDDSYEWELWLDGDVLIFNVAVPNGGSYVVSGGMNRDQADRLGRALAGGVGLLLRGAGRGWRTRCRCCGAWLPACVCWGNLASTGSTFCTPQDHGRAGYG